MPQKHITANKNRWSKVDPVKRKDIMKTLARKRWQNKTKKERKAHAQLMLTARYHDKN